MKFGMRKPSLNKRIAARTSWKRVVRHNMGFKAPRGYGWVTNPKRAAYNRVYNRTTFKADPFIALIIIGVIALIVAIFKGIFSLFSSTPVAGELGAANSTETACPYCHSSMILRNGRRGKFYGCSRFPRCRGTRDYKEPESQIETTVTID
jgi:hypothetical protein